MRLMRTQIDMLELLGEEFPFVASPRNLKIRLRRARQHLVERCGMDFGYDVERWHDYLERENIGGYRWNNRNRGIPRRIREAKANREWLETVQGLQMNEMAKSKLANGSTVKMIYWKDGRWWLGYLQDYPDYRTQGKTLRELQENLRDLYKDIASGEIPGIRKVDDLVVS